MRLLKNSLIAVIATKESEAISKMGLLRHFLPRNDNISAISIYCLDICRMSDYTMYAMHQRKTIVILALVSLLTAGIFLRKASLVPAEINNSELVLVVDLDEMIINPVAQEVISQSIRLAEEKSAQCLIIRMDTPGGLMEATHKIVKEIMNSTVPVVVYVWPQGARAASAGVFITLAGHVAAMSDSTHIGAAHPVVMNNSWGNIDQAMQDKVVNDAKAWIESLAKARNRNARWATQAVTESVSITENEALNLGVIDVVAKNLDELLARLDQRKIKIDTQTITLQTKEARIEFIEQSLRQKFLNHLINPNLAYMLMLLGFFGLMYEITHPGFGFPGLAGIISLILAFYAFQVLPTNYAGLFLIVLGISFFVIEAFTPTFGAFTLAGIAALGFGSTILFNQPYEFLKVSLKLIIPVAMSLGLISTFLVTLAVRAQRRKTISGAEALLEETGIAKTNIGPSGKVFVHGEIWDAKSDEKIKKGENVTIEKVQGLKLIVKKAKEGDEK